MNVIKANPIKIITPACKIPYTMPPILSHCFIIGNFVIISAITFTNINAILTIIKIPIKHNTSTIFNAISFATLFTISFFFSCVAPFACSDTYYIIGDFFSSSDLFSSLLFSFSFSFASKTFTIDV